MTEHDKDTASRLRADIDAGRAHDKVAYPDPAAAPLGTDDEASGHPITPEQARMAHEAEIGRHDAMARGVEDRPIPPTHPDHIPSDQERVYPPETRRLRNIVIVVIAVLLVILILASL